MPEAEELVARVAKLEAQNRSLRFFVACLWAVVAAVLLVEAKSPSLPRDGKFAHLEADDIVVRNGSGSSLHIWSHEGTPEGVALDITKRDASGSRIIVRLAGFADAGQLSVSGRKSSQSITLMPDPLAQAMQSGAGQGPGIIVRGNAPFVSVEDSKKYAAILGASSLSAVDGTDVNTTAGTIHLFNDKNHVVWVAP